MNVPILERREVVVVPPGRPDQSLLSRLTDRGGDQDAGRRLALRLTGAQLRLLQLELPGLQVSQGSPGGHVRRPHARTSLTIRKYFGGIFHLKYFSLPEWSDRRRVLGEDRSRTSVCSAFSPGHCPPALSGPVPAPPSGLSAPSGT